MGRFDAKLTGARSPRRPSFHSSAQAQANAYHEQMKANYVAAYAANPYLLHPQIMAMNAFASAANPHPPNLVEVQTLLNFSVEKPKDAKED